MCSGEYELSDPLLLGAAVVVSVFFPTGIGMYSVFIILNTSKNKILLII
jgi:hypothetical protein